MPTIRPAEIQDIPQITEIYNEAVLNTVATFDTEPRTLEDRKNWFLDHDESHPVLVAAVEGNVVGWAALSRWSERAAYDASAELSVYIAPDFRNRRIGRALMESVIGAGRDAGLHTLISRISAGNEVSIYMHESMGFDKIGVMKEVGRKFGRWIDVHLFQFMYRQLQP
ncbi:MAG TPA: N-acetyltransferase family protein [bacterium]|nr:N-acetyltransferase family protein [bacterium]